MGKSKNILHVIDTTGPGGAETVYIQLAKACNINGYRSIAVIRGPGWVQQQLEEFTIDYKIKDCKGSFNLSYLIALIKIILREDVHVIQSHLLGSNVYTSLAGLLTNTPVISTFHGHVDVSPKERLRRLKFAFISIGSKNIITVTKELKLSLEKLGNRRLSKKTRVISNGVNMEGLVGIENRPLPDGKNETIIFGALGNIREAKNYFLAIDFIEILKSQGLNVKFYIAGDDTKEIATRLKSYIEEKDLASEVFLLGFVADVPDFFRSIDIFLMSSSSEGHPLAITQALAAAKVILTTPSGVEEIVTDNETAFISKSHSAFDLNERFQEMRKNTELVHRVRQNGRILASSEYSLTTMCNQYFSLYRASYE